MPIKFFITYLLILAAKIYIAAVFPLTNDEAYYREWGLYLSPGYLDHPPGVAFLAALGHQLGNSILALRLPGILLGEIALFFIVKSAALLWSYLREDIKKQYYFFFFLQTIFGFGWLGLFLLPDIGLAFALSFFVYRLIKCLDEEHFNYFDAFLLGISAGVAGLFKYHAAPLCLAGLAYLIWQRRLILKKELQHWFLLIVVGLIIISPVIYWNIMNDFASFKFQAAHGFSGGAWRFLYIFQAALGLALLATPLGFFIWLRSLILPRLYLSQKALVWMSAPLAILLVLAALRKPVLPHWFLPCLWVAAPLFFPYVRNHPRLVVLNTCFSIFIISIIGIFFSSSFIKEKLMTEWKLGETPMSELTIWQPLSHDIRAYLEKNHEQFKSAPLAKNCPETPPIYTVRWFSTAQLSYWLNRKIYNIDDQHPSFYSYRDHNIDHKNCRILIVYDQNHENLVLKNKRLEVTSLDEIRPALHNGAVFLIAQAILKP